MPPKLLSFFLKILTMSALSKRLTAALLFFPSSSSVECGCDGHVAGGGGAHLGHAILPPSLSGSPSLG